MLVFFMLNAIFYVCCLFLFCCMLLLMFDACLWYVINHSLCLILVFIMLHPTLYIFDACLLPAILYRVSQKNMTGFLLNILTTKYRIFRSFFPQKNRDPYSNFEYHFCAIFRGRDICKTKWNSWLDDFDQNLNYLI